VKTYLWENSRAGKGAFPIHHGFWLLKDIFLGFSNMKVILAFNNSMVKGKKAVITAVIIKKHS